MEKRKLRILTVVVFAGVLIFGALRQNSTGRGELGEIQVAMWNLGKVDNLQLYKSMTGPSERWTATCSENGGSIWIRRGSEHLSQY